MPLAQIHDGTLHHLHTDHLGTPLEASNDAGRITWRVTYRTWGNVLVQEEEEITQNLRFQGQYFDQETGLHYNRFRYYDPGPGRFVSQDPIGLQGGLSLHEYAKNPIGWIDPLGLIKGGYNGKKPTYENKGHHQPGHPEYRGGGSKTSTLPCHHRQLAAKSVPDSTGTHWYAIDDKGIIHRFGNSNDGNMHWNGDTASARGLEVPSDVRKRLEKMKKDGMAVASC